MIENGLFDIKIDGYTFEMAEKTIRIEILKNVLQDILSRQIVKKMHFKAYIKVLEKVIKKKDSELHKKYEPYIKKNKINNLKEEENIEICASYISNEILSNIINYIEDNLEDKNFCIVSYINSEISKLEKKSKKSKIDNINDSEDDIDDQGNIKNLIDYEYSSADDLDDDDYEDEEDEEDDEEDDYQEGEDYQEDDDQDFNKHNDNFSDTSNDSDSSFDYEQAELEELMDDLLIDYEKLDEDDKIFVKYLYNQKKMNSNKDITYFTKLTKEKKDETLKLISKIDDINQGNKPLYFKALESNMPLKIKAEIIKKIEMKEEGSDSSSYKLINWIDTILTVPFGDYQKDEITKKNTRKEIKEYLKNAHSILDDAIYGHNEAKNKILQVIAQNISNPKSNGIVLGIRGPMGNGKTTLVEKGISKALNRPFSYISLGGATDASYLEGHSYTYEGSLHGKIVDILIKAKKMNPIIYFDELDKVSKTDKGDEIINILMHLIDSSQNTHFHDKYFTGIDFDLSKAIFIFSYNDKSLVNPILLDRITEIDTKGFKTDDKLKIAKNYLLPKIFEDMAFNKKDIQLTNNTLEHIIENYTFEGGVRKFKELLYEIAREINLRKLDDNRLNNKKIKFPLKVSIDMIDNELLSKKHKFINQVIHKNPQVGKINGLYATSNDTGGITIIEILEIPTDSKLQLELTGSQGDVMKESMRVAKTVSWNMLTKKEKNAYCKKWKTDGNTGFHIHCPDASTPKDGPSAGIAITTALVSRLINAPIDHEIGMTGEIDLSGSVLEIGGLENKLCGAKKAGVKKVLCPKQNKSDLDKAIENNPELIEKSKFEVYTVDNIWEVFGHVFPDIVFEKY